MNSILRARMLFSGLTLTDIIIYLLVFAFTIYVWRIETTDIHCPTFNSSKEECAAQGGMAYSNTNASPSDTCTQIIDKISKASSAETATIKWRRSFMLAVLIVFAVCFLVITPTTLPPWLMGVIAIGVAYIIIFMNFQYYDYHVFKNAEDNVSRGIEVLQEKGCIR